jgi:hypothetical protein
MAVLGRLCSLHRYRELRPGRLLVPLLLCLQVCFPSVALSAYLPVRFPHLTCARKQLPSQAKTDRAPSGAEIVFRSFLSPTLGRYFQGPSTASGLRAKADGLDKTE